MGVLLAKVSPEFVGLRRQFRLTFVVLHPLPVSVGPSPFSGVEVVFGHALVAPPATPGFGLF